VFSNGAIIAFGNKFPREWDPGNACEGDVVKANNQTLDTSFLFDIILASAVCQSLFCQKIIKNAQTITF
jgi:hypothetical protein